jgi:hypothetical protein
LQTPNHTWTQERIETFDRVLDSMHSDGDDWHLAFQTGASAGQVQNLSYFIAHHVFENAVTTAQVEAFFPKAIYKWRERLERETQEIEEQVGSKRAREEQQEEEASNKRQRK